MSDTVVLSTDVPTRTPRTSAREARTLRLAGARAVTSVAHGTVAALSPQQVDALRAQGLVVSHYADTDRLRMAGRDLDIAAPTAGMKREELVDDAALDTWPLQVVQLLAPPFPEWRRAVQETGAEVIGVAGAYGLTVRAGDDQVREALAGLPFVTMVSPLQPGWKLDPRLSEASVDAGELSITVVPARATDGLLADLKAQNVPVVRVEEDPRSGGARVVVSAARAEALELARRPEVLSVSWLPLATTEGEREVQIMAENLDAIAVPNQGPVVGYQGFLTAVGATGAGVTVAIADSGIDQGVNNNTTGHLDLRGRQAGYVDYNGVGTDQNGHGTHVAGIAVGNAATGTIEAVAPNNFLWGQGVAPGAQFVGQNMQFAGAPTSSSLTVPAIATLTQDANTNGATVQNNSWSGNPAPTAYSQRESDFDGAVRDANATNTVGDALTAVFAASNAGGLPGTIGDPSSAKNVITVGNGLTRRPTVGFPDDDIRGVNGSSSRGPASGGRLKPDVVAPGTDVSSSLSAASGRPAIAGTTTYTSMTGTSMASPAVAGACAVLTEWWSNRTAGSAPSPAMLKALLVNGAEDLVGGSNWRALSLGHSNPATNTYQLTGVTFTPTQVSVAGIFLTQVGTTVGMADQTWNFNAGTLTCRVALVGNPTPVGFHCLDVPLTNIPNNDQGWGRVSLENIVFQAPVSDRGPRLFSDQRHAFTANGQLQTWRIQPSDTTRPLRITLAWTDAAGAVGSGAPLVNNLNLELAQTVGATTTTWRGNNFQGGFSTSGGAADTANNVECIYIQNPSGVYTLTVRGTTLTQDARDPTATGVWQDFALAVDNAVFAAADPAAVSLLIDRSGSMQTAGYVDVTRTASKQFVDLMTADDSVGVVSFGTNASHDYHAGNEVVTITGATEKTDAKTAIDGLNFTGCTFMGKGLELAETQLASATGNRAVVLLSDGKDNKGCDKTNAAKPWAVDVAAALPTSIDVYTCAMGPLSDQQTLSDIADLSGGRYYYMPTIDDLYEIYNFIRGNVTSTGVIVNTTSTASKSRVAAQVDCGCEQVVLACHWHEPGALRWTGGNPDDGLISVLLRSPTGELVPADASWVSRVEGDGYVIFTIEDPQPGQWFVEVATSRQAHTRYTVGGWVRSGLGLVWKVPGVSGGGLLNFGLGLKGATGSQLKLRATLTAPAMSTPDLLARLQSQLRDIRPDRDLVKNGVDPDLARLMAFDTARVKAGKKSVFTPRTTRVAVRPVQGAPVSLGPVSPFLGGLVTDGILAQPRLVQPALGLGPLVLPDLLRMPRWDWLRPTPLTHGVKVPTKVEGSYTLRVEALGVNPKTGCRFRREEARSFTVAARG